MDHSSFAAVISLRFVPFLTLNDGEKRTLDILCKVVRSNVCKSEIGGDEKHRRPNIKFVTEGLF